MLKVTAIYEKREDGFSRVNIDESHFKAVCSNDGSNGGPVHGPAMPYSRKVDAQGKEVQIFQFKEAQVIVSLDEKLHSTLYMPTEDAERLFSREAIPVPEISGTLELSFPVFIKLATA